MISAQAPLAGALLLTLPVSLLWTRWRTGGLGRGAWVRALLAGVLVLALTQPVWRRPVPGEAVVVVVDPSEVVSEVARRGAEREAQALLAGLDSEDLGASARDLAEAAAWLPMDRPGRVELWSSGRGEDPLPALAALSDRGVTVALHELVPGVDASGVAWIHVLSERHHPGATVEAEVVLQGGPTGLSGALEVRLGERRLEPLEVQVPPGERRTVVLARSVPVAMGRGLFPLSVGGRAPHQVAGVVVEGAPRVGIVGERREATRHVRGWLEAEGFEVARLPVGGLSSAVAELELVVLADVPTDPSVGAALTRADVAALEDHVRGGGGLVVLGGERAYDQGGYHRSPLAKLLPVLIDPSGEEREDAVALVLILDKSGSMATSPGASLVDNAVKQLEGGGGRGSKMSLVRVAAMDALRRLRPGDWSGVVAVDTEARWTYEPRVSGESNLYQLQQVGKLAAGGGGVHVMNGLRLGLPALTKLDAPLRHAILFADASDVDGRGTSVHTSVRFVERQVAKGVSLSVIAVGQAAAADLAYLKRLAEAGGGRFRHAASYSGLRTLFAEEAEQLIGSGLEEERLSVVRAGWHPALRGLTWRSAPALLGRNKVLRRPRTRVLLETEAGDPVLAVWQVGRGQVASFATDLGGAWGRPWLGWSETPKLWTQLARTLARPPRARALSLTVDEGWVEVVAEDALGQRHSTRGVHLHEGAQEVPLTLAGPGRSRGPWSPPVGPWRLTLTDEAGDEVLAREGWGTSEARRWSTPDEARLRAIRALRPRQAPAPRRAPVELWPWLLGLAVLLWPADAWLRRGP